MQGLMQDWPLLCHRIIDHAATQHAERPVVTRSVEGPIHTTNYAEIRTRALKLAAESTRWFREAERLADRLELPPAERAELAREHALATIGVDSSADNERVARRAIELFAAIDDQKGIGWANARLVIPLMQQSRHDEAEHAGRTAIETLEPLGPTPELADALHRLGWFYWRRGREPEADPLLRRAIDIASQTDALLVRAEATQTLAVCQFSYGTFAEAQRLMEEAFALAKEAGDTTNLLRCYNNLAAVRSASYGPAAAADTLSEGLEIALRSGSIGNGAWIAGSLGDLAALLGRLEEAEDRQHLSLDLARRVTDGPLIGQRLATLAELVLVRGRPDEAQVHREAAEPALAANPEPQAAHFLTWADGFFALARHDRHAAAEKFAESATLARAHSADTFPETFTEAVRALERIGAHDRAATFRDLDQSSSSVMSAAHARNVAGLLDPDPARAVETLGEAVVEFERLQMRVAAARAMVDLAHAMTRAGQDPGEVLDSAREILLDCDAQLFLFEVDEVVNVPASAPQASGAAAPGG